MATVAVLAGLLVSCSTSSVLAPPEGIPTGSIAMAPTPSAPMTDWSSAASPQRTIAMPQPQAGPIEARPPSVYGAPEIDVAALPTYDSLASDPANMEMIAGPSDGTPGTLGTLTARPAGAGLGALQGDRPIVSELPAEIQSVAAPPATTIVETQGAAAPPGLQPVSAPSPVAAPAVTASPPVAAPAPAAAPEKPRRLAGLLPRALNPLSRARKAESGLPAEEAACRQRLKRLGVQFTAKPPIGNGRSCGIANPVEVSGLSGNIKVSPATTLNCRMAEAFAEWVKNELAPGVRRRYIAGIDTIGSMGGYSCRTMNSRRGAPMSEHARGNAIDIGSLTLNTGKKIKVRKKGFFAFRERGLLNTVRDDGCQYFTTILGPGSDANHADHFHFDLRARKSGYRHCD